MMNFFTQPQVPEQPTFIVGDYAKKKKLAEALRDRVGKGIKEYDPLITTAANDYFPGQVQVNYAGILGNALNPWLESKQEEKAAAAEGEAQAAQREALDRILANPNISKADAIRAQEELGVDVSSMLPEEMNMAARAQASASRSGLNAMLQMKVISPEEHKAAIAQLEADELAANEAELEQIRAREAAQGGGGRAMTELEYFRNDPEGYAKFMAAKGGSGSIGGGAETALTKTIIDTGKSYSTLKNARTGEAEIGQLVADLAAKEKAKGSRNPFSKEAVIATAADMLPFVEQAQSPEADRIVAYLNTQILAAASGQKGVLSDTDMKIIKDSVASIKKNPASAEAVWKDTINRLDVQQSALESQLSEYGSMNNGQFAPQVTPYYEKPKNNPLEGVVPVVPNTLAAPKPAAKRKTMEEIRAEAEAED